jgi:two-component system sensor histidine kinase/response regulator
MQTKGSILIIDDEEGICKGCCRILRPQGYATDTAANFRDGLQKIQQGQFDLILLDVLMPDGQGINLLEPILKRDPETVPILITGYATVELAVQAVKRGAYDFISKPFTAQMLLMTVEQGLQKRNLSIEAKRLQHIETQATELARAKAEAERLHEFKSSFATTVAHELRAPVGAIQSLVRVLLRGLAGELNEKQNEILNRVEIRLDSLLDLINDLLTLAASKSLEAEKPLQPVNLKRVIQHVFEHFNDAAMEKQITLKYSIPEQGITVQATEEGLGTILDNLVGNAIKYTLAGGLVKVEVLSEQDSMLINVVDTGIGIPAEDLPHIGNEFFRARNAHQRNIAGTGLGLSIVKAFMQKFGYQLEIRSQEGEGTTFSFNIPFWKDKQD